VKIRVGYLDETLGTIEDVAGSQELRFTGNVADLRALVAEFARDTSLTGAPFLRALCDTLNGYWWAQDTAEDLSSRS
jgi:hypothetical protein